MLFHLHSSAGAKPTEGEKKARKMKLCPHFWVAHWLTGKLLWPWWTRGRKKKLIPDKCSTFKDGGKKYIIFPLLPFWFWTEKKAEGSGYDSKDVPFIKLKPTQIKLPCTYPGKHPSVQWGGARARSCRSECCGVSLVSQQTGSSPPSFGCSRTDPDACRSKGRRLKV